jgi:hypothetical protein
MTTLESMLDLWEGGSFDHLTFADVTPTLAEQQNDLLPIPDTFNDKNEGCMDISQNDIKQVQQYNGTQVIDTKPNGWMVCSMQPDLVIEDNSFLLIKVRSRGEDEHYNVIPECFYSSLKYQMHISLDPRIFQNIKTTLLMAKVEIVNENGEQVLNKVGESVIKGQREYTTFELNKENGRLECIIPIKFSSVSFHHSKRNFAFHVSIHDFVGKNMAMLFDVRSTPFPTYARRPKVSDRLPKQVLAPSTVNTAICKKRKTEQGKSAALSRFIKSLEHLMTLKDKLPEDERPLALNALREVLFGQKDASKNNINLTF